MDERKLILLTEAAKRLGISNTTMRRIVRGKKLTVYENPLDKRQKLLAISQIERLRAPMEVGEEGKLAA